MSHCDEFMTDRVPGVIAPFTQPKSADWERILHVVFLTFAIAAVLAGLSIPVASFFADDFVLFQLATLPVLAGLMVVAALSGIASFLLGRAE
jgi:cytochrome b subunit of formate dehydrogenase